MNETLIPQPIPSTDFGAGDGIADGNGLRQATGTPRP